LSNVFEGSMIIDGQRFAVVVSRFNEFLTKQLLSGVIDTLNRHGADEDKIDIAWTPGAYEIPLIAKKLVDSKRYDAIICLGVIIRGNTPHFDHLCSSVTKGISDIALSSGVPITYGVITADNLEQAIERSGAKMGNKGREAANSAIEMSNIVRDIESSKD